MTLGVVVMASVAFFFLFKAIFREGCTEVWYYVRYLNTYILLSIGACLIMFQYPLALCVTIFFFLQLGVSAPITRARAGGCLSPSGMLGPVTSVLWVILASTLIFALLFGSVVAAAEYDPAEVAKSLLSITEQAMLDFQCVGQRGYFFLVAVGVPNLLILAKTLTN